MSAPTFDPTKSEMYQREQAAAQEKSDLQTVLSYVAVTRGHCVVIPPNDDAMAAADRYRAEHKSER